MTMQTPFPAAASSQLPAGVTIQPRRFDWNDLASVPQHWFARNPIISHMENKVVLFDPDTEELKLS